MAMMQVEVQFLSNVVTRIYNMRACRDGYWDQIALFPSTKMKAVLAMKDRILELCQIIPDWDQLRNEIKLLIDDAPDVHPADISAQVDDPLRAMRRGSPLGDLLEQSVNGDQAATLRFPYTTLREEMVRTYGSHVVRFTTITGQPLGSGVLLLLPSASPAILTCSHVWTALRVEREVQILCAAAAHVIPILQATIQIPCRDLRVLDMADELFMARAGVDAMSFRRDAAIIAGSFVNLLPKGARPFDLRNVGDLEPEAENYAVVGYPVNAKGDLRAQFLEHASPTRNEHVFTRHPRDESVGSLNGSSGGLVVARRGHMYRPVALMIGQSGSVGSASSDSRQWSDEPSLYYALPLIKLREMVEKAKTLHFVDHDGQIKQQVIM